MTSRGSQQVPPVVAHVGDWSVWQLDGMLPIAYEYFLDSAKLSEQIGVKGDGYLWFCAVGFKETQWPQLVVAQRYEPGPEGGFGTGILVVPETSLVFLGAGERLLCYSMEVPSEPRRLWEDVAEIGFWRWTRAGDTILMCAELELVAFTIDGAKLWTMVVEPPWSVEVDGLGEAAVDVMGRISRFPVRFGPTGL